VLLSVACALAWWRGLSGRPLNPLAGVSLGPDAVFWLPMVLVVLVICSVMLLPLVGQGRSPHLLYRPEQLDVGLDDVKGLGTVRTRSSRR
jgi:cell division protease FtsH